MHFLRPQLQKCNRSYRPSQCIFSSILGHNSSNAQTELDCQFGLDNWPLASTPPQYPRIWKGREKRGHMPPILLPCIYLQRYSLVLGHQSGDIREPLLILHYINGLLSNWPNPRKCAQSLCTATIRRSNSYDGWTWSDKCLRLHLDRLISSHTWVPLSQFKRRETAECYLNLRDR